MIYTFAIIIETDSLFIPPNEEELLCFFPKGCQTYSTEDGPPCLMGKSNPFFMGAGTT